MQDFDTGAVLSLLFSAQKASFSLFTFFQLLQNLAEQSCLPIAFSGSSTILDSEFILLSNIKCDGFNTSSPTSSYSYVNGFELSVHSISTNTVANSSLVSLVLPNVFLKHYFLQPFSQAPQLACSFQVKFPFYFGVVDI